MTRVDFRIGHRRFSALVVASKRALEVREEPLGYKASIPFDALFADRFSADTLRRLFDPILARRLLEAVRRRIKARDGYTCRYCGRAGTPRLDPDKRPWHIDHIIPVVAGGTDDDDNLALACEACNLAKRADLGWGAEDA